MREQRRQFTREFKLEALRLVWKGRPATEVPRELDIRTSSLYRWKRQFEKDRNESFPGNGKLKARDEELEKLRREVTKLRAENAFPKKSVRLLRQGPAVKYERIEEERGRTPVRWLCSALEISPRGCYSWRRREPCRRQCEDRRLLVEIRASYEGSERTYGSPRVTKDLRAVGYRCSQKRVARIMRENGLVAVQKRCFRVTTQLGHRLPAAANVLARRFIAEAPNRTRLADITYIATEEGWLYLAVLMDLYSRRILGWNAASRMDRSLTIGRSSRRSYAVGHHPD